MGRGGIGEVWKVWRRKGTKWGEVECRKGRNRREGKTKEKGSRNIEENNHIRLVSFRGRHK